MITETVKAKWKHFSYRLKTRKEIFTEIYDRGGFTGNSFPKSGAGSTLEQTVTVREQLASLFKEYNIKSIIDAPCGDFNWMKEVDLTGVTYYGFDIVKSVVETNRLTYSSNTIHFDELDIVNDTPPVTAEMIFCRDCLVHLSNKDALNAIKNFKKSGSKYFLSTTFTSVSANPDLVSGRGWRSLNLEKAPFNFPPPISLIIENCTEFGSDFKDKSMGLWLFDDL